MKTTIRIELPKILVKFDKDKVCFLYSTVQPNGFMLWEMESLCTGKHAVIENGFTDRVHCHWNGFLDNQPTK